MKLRKWLAIVLSVTVGSGIMAAQAPAGSTGQCKDGSYTSAAKKSGACSGHKGVQTWFAASGSAPASAAPSPAQPASNTQAATPTPHAPSGTQAQSAPVNSQPAPSPAPAQSMSTAGTGTQRAQAPGGGPGMVWVNTSTKVYHCPGKEFYGTTKNGKYMSEADAIAMGARADHNKPCSK